MVGSDSANVLTTSLNRELKQRPRQRERKKSSWFRWAKQQLYTFIIFFCIFLTLMHDNDMKLPHFTFCRGREHKKRISFSVFNLDKVSYSVKLQKNSPKFDKFNDMEYKRRIFSGASCVGNLVIYASKKFWFWQLESSVRPYVHSVM